MMTTCGWSFELTLDRATAEAHAASCNIVHHVELGLRHYSREGLEAAQAIGQTLDIRVLGLASIAQDVTPELAPATA